ncbi:MAG TPA: ferritin family protein [Gammaproteobacteria bacterium]|nr:ferritin family protein [Gammaproteobacteria bacterium]
MTQTGEGTAHGIDRLRGKTTMREILEVATGFEASARDFYTGLIPKVSKRIRYLVEELAAEEQEHYDLFTKLAGRADVADQIKVEIERTASDSKFSDCLHLPNLGEQPDDQAVLQYAMGREHAAMQHYGELANTTPPRADPRFVRLPCQRRNKAQAGTRKALLRNNPPRWRCIKIGAGGIHPSLPLRNRAIFKPKGNRTTTSLACLTAI